MTQLRNPHRANLARLDVIAADIVERTSNPHSHSSLTSALRKTAKE
jgi:hypothetical protein